MMASSGNSQMMGVSQIFCGLSFEQLLMSDLSLCNADGFVALKVQTI